jgi:hypothetical protein
VLCQSNAPELLSLFLESCGVVLHSTGSVIVPRVLGLCVVSGERSRTTVIVLGVSHFVIVSFPFLVFYCPCIYIYTAVDWEFPLSLIPSAAG